MATKTQYRNISAHQLESLIKAIAPMLDTELEPLFEEVLREGESLPDLNFMAELIKRLVFLHLDRLNEADARLRVLRAQMTRLAAERDQDAAEAYNTIKRAWGSVKGAYTEVDARALTAIQGRLPRDPFRVLNLAKEMSSNLGRPPADVKPVLDTLKPAALKAWAKELKKSGDALDRSYEQALNASRGIELAKVIRDEALGEFNRIFFYGALTVESFSGLAGNEMAAREARPSRRVKGVLFVDERRRRSRGKAKAKSAGKSQ